MNWKWYKSDLPAKNGLKVFSCFSCGGGSSYGYKLAGYDVIGCCEIDEKINAMYVKNHHPKFNYLMDIRDFNALGDYPDELKDLDVLDGSPPCSTFSTAGKREKGWGVEKQFREGQKMQRLDDLFFAFLDTVSVLRPKVVVAENVEGLIKGKARGYVSEIIQGFKDLGYSVQLFDLNGENMGVPQARGRVFFIANRMGFPKLELKFTEKPILFGEVKSEEAGNKQCTDFEQMMLLGRGEKDGRFADVRNKTSGTLSGFSQRFVPDNKVCATVCAGGTYWRKDRDKWNVFSDQDFVSVQTFPQDYDFDGNSPQYVCGMSVPPVMMYRIADEIRKQWFKK